MVNLICQRQKKFRTSPYFFFLEESSELTSEPSPLTYQSLNPSSWVSRNQVQMGDSWTGTSPLQTPPSSLLLGRRVQWSRQHVGETWLCWSQSLSFLNKHFPFWNNHLPIYRKLLQSKSHVLWERIFLKLFSSFYKTPAGPLPSGLYLFVNTVDQRHLTKTIWIPMQLLCSPPPPHGFWDCVCNHKPQYFGNHLPISLPPSWFSGEQKETCLLPGRKSRP